MSTEQPYQVGDIVDLSEWDATEPPHKQQYGKCRVDMIWQTRAAQSGWLLRLRSLADPGYMIELDSAWARPAGGDDGPTT